MSKKIIYIGLLASVFGGLITFGFMRYMHTKTFNTVMLMQAQETFLNNEAYIRLIEEDKLEHAINLIKSTIYCKKVIYTIAAEKLEGKDFVKQKEHLLAIDKYKEFGKSCDSYRNNES